VKFFCWRWLQGINTFNPVNSNTTQSARNLGFIFDEHLSFCDQISALSKSCYPAICISVVLAGKLIFFYLWYQPQLRYGN